ncbi:MAG TPA: DnaJ domain-containing protein [Anaeromyxobacteraceae bacterium]|nr:DnaJ domain-containing protein [Anaeromyxobacteraceae bacterium]
MATEHGGERERAAELLFGARPPDVGSADEWRREIREAFRRRALETHPDRSAALGRSEAALAREFRQLFEAYQVLSRLGPAPGAPRAADPRQPKASQDHVHCGTVPRRPLLFAEFLYYSGRVSWRNLVEAVAWQRRQRPAIGRIAVEWGHLSEDEVREILERRRREGSGGEPFGEYARRQGFLSRAQLLALLGRQRRLQRRIGQFFVEAGLIGQGEVLSFEDDLNRHNARYCRSA